MTADELEELLDNITPGPWTAEHRHIDCTEYDDERSGLGLEIHGPAEPILRGQFARSADARLIAAAPVIAQRLLASMRAEAAKENPQPP